MTLVAEALLAVFDVFQQKEGVWRSTLPLSYQEVDRALQGARLSFAEWDPERGLYYLDFSPPGSELITVDLLMLDLRGPRGSDHFRLEWAVGGVLTGVELQTHAPGPLPFASELLPWIEPDRVGASPPLTIEAWTVYLEELAPQTPAL